MNRTILALAAVGGLGLVAFLVWWKRKAAQDAAKAEYQQTHSYISEKTGKRVVSKNLAAKARAAGKRRAEAAAGGGSVAGLGMMRGVDLSDAIHGNGYVGGGILGWKN